MSTPPTSAAGAASRTRLPPSPETTSMIPPADNAVLPKHLSIHDDTADSTSDSSRLRSVARYGTFHPQAIACSTPLVTNYSSERDDSKPSAPQRGGTSVAAIAGPQGVALFRVSRPHTPLVVLSHASSRKSSTGSVSALSFQPQTKDSLLLAAARGNGILVWDASGHSLSPLLGRLTMESTLSSSDRITSISWKGTSAQSLLATTNATNACLWDLRTALRANSSRPSVRLGSSRKINVDGSVIDPLVQIAASNKNEVATLDVAGTVFVFDVRMTDRSPGNIGEVSSFSAFNHVGIGLEFLPSLKEDARWVTWGLDGPQSDAIVKVWSDNAASNRKESDADSYWYMDSSPTTSPKTSIAMSESSNKSAQMQYRQVAEFSSPYLACARVCPDPFENHVVTVGMIPGSSGAGTNGWQAEMWKLKEPMDNNSVEEENQGVDKITSFQVLNDVETSSIVGTNATLGSLRGAELALEPSRGVQGLQQEEDMDSDKEGGMDLLLCSLSEKGYVTTHTIFEAPTHDPGGRKGHGVSGRNDSPRRSRSQTERPSTFSDRTRVFPGDGNHVQDAASMLRANGDSEVMDSVNPNDLAYHGGVAEQPGPSGSLQKINQYDHERRPDDGTSTQFDMDVPVAYGAPIPGQGVNGMDVAEPASPPVVLLSKGDEAIEIGLQRRSMTEQIDKDKVPCPRLCGGSFSPGIGGIVCFNNGEVRRMWSWYEQSDPSRKVHAPAAKGRPTSSQQNNETVQEDSSVFSSTKEEISPSLRQECPRTLKDLEDMTDHARFSQWRSDESSGGESSIDDQSDESLDGFAFGDGEDGDEARRRMYAKYFGAAQESLSSPQGEDERGKSEDSISLPRSPPRQKQPSVGSKSNEIASGGAFFGQTAVASDLVPAVFISHEQDGLVFNGQSEELARGWMLSALDTVDDNDEEETPSLRGLSERERSTDSISTRDAFGWGFDEGAVLPRPRSAEYHIPLEKEAPMSPSRKMQRVRSDPMLLLAQQTRNKYGVVSGDDDPVHAGAYSKRPNRNESLVFLKKLVSHQRGDRQLQSLMMSPPDSPLLPNKMPFGGRKKRSSSTGGIVQTPSPTSVAVDESDLGDSDKAVPLGVYTLSEERGPPHRTKLREERLRDACSHNAEVCISLGQIEKANVWNLLAQMAENVLEDEHDNFNGWGGPYCGSLGHDLISSFLRFYEAQGDVQMLATMVCVLGGGQRKKVAQGCSLLPTSHEDRYDSYIRCYAEVLYGWRLMSIRAEVNKHLVQRLPAPSGDDQYAAVDTVVWCSRCQQEATNDNGICRHCRNYAFRCSLCDIAVRGLFTVCFCCGHGGHTSHLMEWFNKHSVCPTGCGCECALVTTMQMGDVREVSSKAVQPMLAEVLRKTPELLLAGAGQIPVDVEGAD